MKSRLHTSYDEATALEELHQRGWTDGLPVVIPTVERVEQMLLGGGLDPDIILGHVGPGYGEATVEKVAVNAVMAGCLPEHFPVVIAAVRAVCDDGFDLGVLQSTTHALGPVVIVNGPAREICGNIASGWGALGPGHRANASIGRALRLVLGNIGGAQPGISDMAVLGQPGKFTACFAEAEETSPFPPLHVARGFGPDQSAVTVVGVEAPHSVIATPDGDDPDAADRMLRTLAASIANAGANSTYGGQGTTLVVLNPAHARILEKGGHTRESVQQKLHEYAVTPKRVLNTWAPMRMHPAENGDELVRAIASPEKVVVAVAGGEGIYSAVFNCWGGGEHAVVPVTTEIEIGQACELPVGPVGGAVHA
ncbi:MAG: hypothetical protein IT303_01665 [Dehalococcoidia bacterium]|nr:hypothetical protein [Dehalococcoidia bacterium]